MKNETKYNIIVLVSWSILLFWLLDIFNFPFMEIFDTYYPMNGWFWLFFYIFAPSIETKIKENVDKT